MNRVYEKTGASAIRRGKPLEKGIKGKVRFDVVPVEDAFIVQFREPIQRGGFQLYDGLTLNEMKEMEQWKEIINQIKKQIKAISKILK